MKKKEPKCVYCGCSEPMYLTRDHKMPKSRGGTDDESNIQVCCWECNQIKDSLTHKEFLEYRKALRILFKLSKISVERPSNLRLLFRQHHFPREEFIKQRKNETTNDN